MWRVLPLIGTLLFLVLGIGGRAWLQRRRHGGSGIMLFRSPDRGQLLRDGLLAVLFVLMTAQAVVAALSSEARPPAPSPLAVRLRPVGAAVFGAGLALFLVAQLNLGASWRIGIEEPARPGLVTTGVYRFCRNPIFLFMLVMFIGYAMLLPTSLSVLMVVGAFIGVRQQALAEEAYLLQAYGEEYRAYARRVGRFVPGLGRLS